MKIEIRKEFEYNPIGSYSGFHPNPYTILFCYPKNEKPFIVKGGLIDCENEIDEIKTPIIIHATYFHKGKTRRNIEFKNFKFSVYCHKPFENGYELKYFDKTGNLFIIKEIKRMPRKWIKELDILT